MTDTHLAILLDRFVRRLHIALVEKAKSFDQDKVGAGGAIILLTLSETGEVPMHELSARLMRDKSQMTRAVQALEAKKMVVRRSSDSDSRVSLIALSDKGWALVETHQRVLAEELDRLLGPVSEVERSALIDILRRAVA